MDPWRTPLTEENMTGFSLRENLLTHIEESRERMGIPKAEFRICDWGCGRGRSVLRLRELGYDAYGADINEVSISCATELYQSRGLDSGILLRIIEENGTTSFEDEFFHFVFSEQVFEHVENLDLVCAELARISLPEAEAQHTFPAHHGFIEPHLLMPFVHWLPKNNLRKYAIAFFMLFGYGPDFDTVRGKRFMERADIYYQGNIQSSFYRHYRVIRRYLEKYGFDVEFIAIKHKKLQRIPGFKVATKIPPVRNTIHWFLLSFVAMALATKKRP